MPPRLEVIVGPMFSGKTERLIAKLYRAQYARKRIRILKPVSLRVPIYRKRCYDEPINRSAGNS